MKKIICMLLAVLLCLGMILPMVAGAQEFVPSVTYKGNPFIVDVDTNMVIDGKDWSGDMMDGCIVVTNVTQAREKTTDIMQEERDTLIEVYEALRDGDMTLPLKEGYVIRELVDISFLYEKCRKIPDHDEKHIQLSKEGTTVTIVFDMELPADLEIVVLTYINDEWTQVEEVVNNGDGTLTCVFEDLCPVAFAVENVQKAATDNPNSGDPMAQTMGLWIGLMVVCAVGVIVLVVSMNRKRK